MLVNTKGHQTDFAKKAFLRSAVRPLRALKRATPPGSERSTAVYSAKQPSVAVIGAGAAGLTAAYFAAQSGAQVTVLERTPEAGKKVLISGGTRCNVLPMDVNIQRDFFSESSQSAVQAVIASWTLDSCKIWLEEEIGLQLAFEEGTSKYFPQSNSAREVRDKLVAACARHGVKFRYNASVKGLERGSHNTWICRLANGGLHQTDRLVMATGGLSFPALGTDGAGLRLLEALGHTLHQPYPALTPLRGTHVAAAQLAGLSLYSARLQCGASAPGQKGKKRKARQQTAERSALLFTHRGFSGPAILDLSHHLVRRWERDQAIQSITVNWTGEELPMWEQRIKQAGAASVVGLLRQNGIPARLADAIAAEVGVQDKQVAQLKKHEAHALLSRLVSYPLACTGHEGYPKAEVTGGGVRLEDVDCATLESRLHPGIYICGELLDVFGRIGGFNFYWAWLTGRLAGSAAAA